MEKILVVGKNSFIGNSLLNVKDENQFYSISYNDLYDTDLTQFNTVVNCSLHPYYKKSIYHHGIDVDFDVARMAYKYNCHYVMLSTRKIYGTSKTLRMYYEFDKENPYDHYSENKLKSENKIISRFGDKVTIIRGSNLFGEELGRPSMMGYFLNQLDKDGVIRYNINPITSKDIIHVDDASEIISKVCVKKPVGIYNLGTSVPYTMLDIGTALVSGYYGERDDSKIIVEGDDYGEQFVLSTNKICSTLGINTPSVENYNNIINKIGVKLHARSCN